jgi:protein gp37
MADKTGIQWTEATWNPLAGCSVVSPGCTNCYAMREAGGRLKSSAKFAGLTEPSKAGPVWTGEVRLWERVLDQPVRWTKPRRIFVNSMSDLFHESVPDEWIDRVFAVMALCPQHTFQVLTKRADRMRDYCSSPYNGVALSFKWPLPNVWLGVSVEDQARADGRIPRLLDTPAAVRCLVRASPRPR